MYLGWNGLGRFFIEGLRTDSLYLIPNVLRVSQLLAGILFIGSVGMLIFVNNRLKNKSAFEGYVPVYSELIINDGENKEDDGTNESKDEEIAENADKDTVEVSDKDKQEEDVIENKDKIVNEEKKDKEEKEEKEDNTPHKSEE